MKTMKILVIDDQAFTERADKFQHLNALGEVTRYDRMPSWNFFEGFDIICWDNDLGGSSEVVNDLRLLSWEDHDKFVALFKDKFHIIHSANNVAGPRLHHLFIDIGAKALMFEIGGFEKLPEALE
jgi:hypothetical protein